MVILVLIIGCQTLPAQAWSRNGHMIIAAMTYRALPDALKAEYTALLRQHPDYEKWAALHAELRVDIDLGEFLFMRASVWPDEIRRKGNAYDHPTWHYTNFPVITDGFPLEETLTPDNDVIFAINESARILRDASATKVDQAAHLSWILHTIGDIHQPMHCVALVNLVYPQGDRGGNLFFVRPSENSRGMNLHAYWDGLLGTSGRIQDARNDATLLWSQLAAGMEADVNPDFDVRGWALEGREIAITHVYLEGELDGAVEEARHVAVVLPETYGRRAKSIAQERAVIASLRLLRVLSEL